MAAPLIPLTCPQPHLCWPQIEVRNRTLCRCPFTDPQPDCSIAGASGEMAGIGGPCTSPHDARMRLVHPLHKPEGLVTCKTASLIYELAQQLLFSDTRWAAGNGLAMVGGTDLWCRDTWQKLDAACMYYTALVRLEGKDGWLLCDISP